MRTIDADEARRMREEGAVLLDALPEDSYATRHIPGARNLPVGADDFEEKAQRLIPSKDTDVVVYCADEDCQASPEAAKRLESMGYENVFDFEGGLKAWRQAGNELAGEPQTIHS